MEYPKTGNLFNRDPDTHLTPAALGLQSPAVGQIDRWLVTEKIDGMNMRVVWHPANGQLEEELYIYGRTDRAQIPGDLMATMRETFTSLALSKAFDTSDEHDPEALLPDRVVLFGEGFGAGIQAGAHYGPTKQFRLFDVVVNDWWLQWSAVEDIAQKLGIETVPVLARSATLDYVQTLVKVGASELLGDGHPKVEGVVARTDPYLFDQRGHRVMFKYKGKDVA
jgi:hypothetical protein